MTSLSLKMAALHGVTFLVFIRNWLCFKLCGRQHGLIMGCISDSLALVLPSPLIRHNYDMSCDMSLFDLILYVQSTIFQLCRDCSSWVEPVLSKD